MLRVLAIGAVLTTFGAAAQTEMPWGDTLHWTDFRGRAPSNTGHDAYTSYRIQVKTVRSPDGTIIPEVACLFDPTTSWVSLEGRRNMALLDHERLHFDIGEVHARQLRSRLAERSPDADLEHALRSALDQATRSSRRMQERYDEETGHGVNTEAQARWKDRVMRMLQDLAMFAAPAP